MLAAGEVDAVITTLAAPAYSLQQAAAGTGIKLISIGTQERAILAGAHPDLVPVTLPPNTYPGQTDSVETVAVDRSPGRPRRPCRTRRSRPSWASCLAGSTSSPPAARPGSLIAKASARTGLTLPLHPAAERFLLRTTATQ